MSARRRDVNKEQAEALSLLERVAVWVTDRVGTPGFFLIILAWTVIWMGWNIFVPRAMVFDAAPTFQTWLFVSNMLQIFLMPLIMVGQNLQGRHAEARAERDLEVDLETEREMHDVLHLLRELHQKLR